MITKRQLGALLLVLGLLASVVILAVDLIGAGDFQGLGPAQRFGLSVTLLIAVIGLTLIPLGDRPA